MQIIYPPPLGEDFLYHLTVDIGKAEIPAGMVECQAFMIQTQLLEDRCLHVVDMHGILGGMKAKVIGFPNRQARLDGTPRHPE